VLEVIFSKKPASFAAIHIWEANIEKDKIGVAIFDGCESLGGAVRDFRFKFLVQGKLFRQRARQVLIVVDNQDIARIAHIASGSPPSPMFLI
jgi:hypothetical protein